MKRRKTMKKIKRQTFLILSLGLLMLSFSQLATAQKPEKKGNPPLSKLPETIKGTIYFKEVSGNNFHKLDCKHFLVRFSNYGKGGGATQGSGDFSKRQCSYSISWGLQPDTDYKPSIELENWGKCDQMSMEAYDPKVVLRVKKGKTHTFNFTVKKVSCTVLK
jgi:hypothetical protein